MRITFFCLCYNIFKEVNTDAQQNSNCVEFYCVEFTSKTPVIV